MYVTYIHTSSRAISHLSLSFGISAFNRTNIPQARHQHEHRSRYICMYMACNMPCHMPLLASLACHSCDHAITFANIQQTASHLASRILRSFVHLGISFRLLRFLLISPKASLSSSQNVAASFGVGISTHTHIHLHTHTHTNNYLHNS